jgi:hypothetical protein
MLGHASKSGAQGLCENPCLALASWTPKVTGAGRYGGAETPHLTGAVLFVIHNPATMNFREKRSLGGRMTSDRVTSDENQISTLRSSLGRGRRRGAGRFGGKTKPNKAKWVKANIISEMYEKFRKQSQTTYPDYFQLIERILGRFFRKNECYPPTNSEISETKPNKAKWVKPCIMSEMSRKFRKRSQSVYPLVFQRLTTEKGPVFAKNEWRRAGRSSEARMKAKTNCNVHPLGNMPLSSISAKRTDGDKSLILNRLILKILKRFIRCHQQSRGTEAQPPSIRCSRMRFKAKQLFTLE